MKSGGMGSTHLHSPLALLVVMVMMMMIYPPARSSAEANEGRIQIPPSSCKRMCGDVEIPYPFGVRNDKAGEGCSLQTVFQVICKDTYKPPRPFLAENMEMTSINISSSEMRILLPISYACFSDTTGSAYNNWNTWNTTVGPGTYPYRLSSTKNVFMAVGCETFARFRIGQSFAGCISGCDSVETAANGSCTGFGCCQTPIPENVSYFETTYYNRYNGSQTYLFNPCNYFFINEKGNYTFHRDDLEHMDTKRTFPVVLDWAIRDKKSCNEAINSPGYACNGRNTECVNSTNGPGYTCRCKHGFQGNPYLSDGCIDVDECNGTFTSLYPCYGKCVNKDGGYDCFCPKGYQSSDPYREKCVRNLAITYIEIVCGMVLLLLIFSLVVWYFTGLYHKKLREKYFEGHGGNYLGGIANGGSRFKIYNMAHLKAVTKNFETNLGEGGFGIVYRGLSKDQGEIAVKKSKFKDDKGGVALANEIILLSQVNHDNIVKLLGCCLEDEVPILIYEYVPNGTLESLIHGGDPFSFSTRVHIITEISKGFKHLHDIGILHGDVKPANILLDKKHRAKISDFGTSRLANDNSWFAKAVQGTLGYLDPDYAATGHLTTKSDVYSFGVVLMEVLTRKKPLNIDGTTAIEKSLVVNFRYCFYGHKLKEIVDSELLKDVTSEERLFEELKKVSAIALRCVNKIGEDRPTMEEIVKELETIHV